MTVVETERKIALNSIEQQKKCLLDAKLGNKKFKLAELKRKSLAAKKEVET